MKGLLKFVVCGSVDDGKSTLIGHMLYDAKLIYADQKRALELDSRLGSRNGKLDYSLLLDGLMAEREQGITIDVAYRYFSTKTRSFIVADAPGHDEYTRNMAVGAAFADLAVILVDATRGVLPQTRRHAKICALMGIRYFLFAVNKMDLANYAETRYRKLVEEIQKLTVEIDLANIKVIPLSATEGDNIVRLSENMSWYVEEGGVPLLTYLENVEIRQKQENDKLILPIQRVCRPDASFRGFQGEIVAGKVSIGEKIFVLPSGECAHIRDIFVTDHRCSSAEKGQPVTICLDKEVDVSRGDVMVTDEDSSIIGTMFVADVLWMDNSRFTVGKNFWCKIGTKLVPASILRIRHKLNIQTGEKLSASFLEKNSIASCEIALAEKTVFQSFERNKTLGAFILIDRITYATSACGMIRHSLRQSDNLSWQSLDITRELRAKSLSQVPKTIWFTGLSGAGKSTLANAVEKNLYMRGKHTMLLDGDNIRMGLNKNLGFTEQDRVENIRRIAEVAKLMNDAGLIVLTAFISPYRADRKKAREIIGQDNFIEVYVSTPLEICEKRDVKGLYRNAREGKIPNFTGISSPYEPPVAPEVVIDTGNTSQDDSVKWLMEKLGRVE